MSNRQSKLIVPIVPIERKGPLKKRERRSPRLRTETLLKNRNYLRELYQAGHSTSDITPLQVLLRGKRHELNLTVALIMNCINRNFMLPVQARQKLRPYKVILILFWLI